MPPTVQSSTTSGVFSNLLADLGGGVDLVSPAPSVLLGVGEDGGAGPLRAVPVRAGSASTSTSIATSTPKPASLSASTSASTPNFLPRPPPAPPRASRPPALEGGLRRRQPAFDADELEAEYAGASTARPPSSLSDEAGEAEEEKEKKEKEENSSRAIQAGLMGELVRMATVLKGNSIALGQALERDRHLVEAAESKLSTNLDFMTRTRGRLGEYTHMARSSTWLTIYSVVTVVVSWIVIFVLIRLT